jgi:Dynein heavy chain region D6 P-loop domain
VLSTGSDPNKDLLQLAEDMGVTDSLRMIALGQGQGAIAARLLEQGSQEGHWVLLQNCHLAIRYSCCCYCYCAATVTAATASAAAIRSIAYMLLHAGVFDRVFADSVTVQCYCVLASRVKQCYEVNAALKLPVAAAVAQYT